MMHSLDFDNQDWERWIDETQPRDWWREQDAQLEREELEAIERQAQIYDYQLNGYED